MVWLGQVGQVGQVTELPSFTWLFYTWSRWAIAVREVKIITRILRRKKGLLSCGSSNVGVLTKVMILQNAVIDFSFLLRGRCQITRHDKLAAHEPQTWEWAFGLAFSVTGKQQLLSHHLWRQVWYSRCPFISFIFPAFLASFRLPPCGARRCTATLGSVQLELFRETLEIWRHE